MKKNNGGGANNSAADGALLGGLAASAAGPVARPALEWAAMPERRVGARASADPDFQEEVKRVLLGRYTPAAVLVDDSMNVLHVHGSVNPFLEQPRGAPIANLVKMARGDLGIAIRAAVLKAKSEDRPVSKSVRCVADGRPLGLMIDVLSVRSGSDRRRGYLVLFKTDAGSGAGAESGGPIGQLEFADREVCESCLAKSAVETRTRLEVNGELAAAKEELQAANAELIAVNAELRKGNADLNAANDDLHNLLASSQIPIVMLDRKMRIRRLTRPAEAAFGLTSADVGLSLAGLKLDIDAPLLKEAIRNVIAGFEARQLEVLSTRERWYSLWIRPYRTAVNVIDGAVLSMTDITEKKSGIKALEAARDYAEAIVDAVSDSLLILNTHLKVKTASRFYHEMFQELPADVEGRSIYELGGGRWNVPELRGRLSELAARGTPFSGWEMECDVPKLGRRTLTVSGRTAPHGADVERRVVIAIEDVTPRKQAAEAAALRKSEARQRDFVANVSHELMTPIAAIKGYSESLVAGALEVPERRVEFTQIIEKNADRLAELVEDLLLLSSHDAGRFKSSSADVSLRATVEKTVRGMAPAARGRSVSVRVMMSPRLRAAISRAELAQVVQNLCENAIKYSRKKGRVAIRARRVGKKIVVSVQDNGIGIPKKDLPRVFDRFHRAENARLKTQRGNGLGLSIVRSILANRGCRVRADSVEGKGTIVSFTLPIAGKCAR